MTISTETWNWPQYLVVALWVVKFFVSCFYEGNHTKTIVGNITSTLIVIAISAFVLTSGGFFG